MDCNYSGCFWHVAFWAFVTLLGCPCSHGRHFSTGKAAWNESFLSNELCLASTDVNFVAGITYNVDGLQNCIVVPASAEEIQKVYHPWFRCSWFLFQFTVVVVHWLFYSKVACFNGIVRPLPSCISEKLMDQYRCADSGAHFWLE